MGLAAARAKDPRSIERLVRWVTVASSTLSRRLTLVLVPGCWPAGAGPRESRAREGIERVLSVHRCGNTTSDNTCQEGQDRRRIRGAVVSLLGLRLCSTRGWVAVAASIVERPDPIHGGFDEIHVVQPDAVALSAGRFPRQAPFRVGRHP